jgi:hypothetical protein
MCDLHLQPDPCQDLDTGEVDVTYTIEMRRSPNITDAEVNRRLTTCYDLLFSLAAAIPVLGLYDTHLQVGGGRKWDYRSAFWHKPLKMKPTSSLKMGSSDGTARVNTMMSP